MKKIKLGVIFGGMSTEHDISVVSGTSVISNLDKEKYEIIPIYIDNDGQFYECLNVNEKYVLGDTPKDIKKIDNIIDTLKKLDIVFPVLHGSYGEDGTIQGLLELLKIPYVGCKVLSSSVAMDKVYSKIIFDKAGLKQAKYEYIRKYNDKYIYIDKKFNESIYSLEEVSEVISSSLTYPLFVKPSNSGSSVGINKAHNKQELEEYIEYASKYDNKILIEENIIGKEIECSVMGNEDVKASCLGEITPAENFYTFEAKYKNSESRLTIPASINEELSDEVRKLAIKAYKAIDGKGLSRVDFFVNEETHDIYINEINTMPGFTEISMYPKLWAATGLSYSELLDKVIKLALDKE